MAKFDKFAELVTYIQSLLLMGLDVVICITGEEQSGKSTLAIQIVRALQDGVIDFEENIWYRTSECLRKLPNIPMYGKFILDEAIRTFYKREWNKASHKELNMIFAQIGMKKAVFLFCIPNFLDLDKFYRDHRVKIWLRVLGSDWDYENKKPRLFYAAAFLKDTADNNPDKWFLASTWAEEKRKMEKGKLKPMLITDEIEKKLSRLRNNPCLKWDFTYAPLNDNDWQTYFSISSAKKLQNEGIDLEGKREKMWKDRCAKLAQFAMKNYQATQNELSDGLGISKAMLGTITKQAKTEDKPITP